MKKRLLAGALCLALLLALAVPAAKAEENVFFTAMGESILPLNDETMPFLSGSSIYIPSSIFTGTVRKNLDVSSTRNREEQVVILYRGSQSLWFPLGADHARDHEDNIYYPGAIVKGDEVFVSASLVARFFGLAYSLTEVPHGYMVWFRKGDYLLSDTHFADAASYSMESRYADYLKTRAEHSSATDKEQTETVMDGKPLYLCLRPGEAADACLDTLENAGVQGAMFFTPGEMAAQGSLLRRCAAMGHSVGILLDETAETPLLDQAAAANSAMEEATCGRTRLVYLPKAGPDALDLLRQAGYCPVTMDLSASALYSATQAEALVRQVSGRSGSVTLWLGAGLNTTGLRSLLRQVEQAEGRCRALTETA